MRREPREPYGTYNFNMKEFKYKFDWTDNQHWVLPDGEEVCQAVLFPQVDEAVKRAIAMTANRDMCIQGGMGKFQAGIRFKGLRKAGEWGITKRKNPQPAPRNRKY